MQKLRCGYLLIFICLMIVQQEFDIVQLNLGFYRRGKSLKTWKSQGIFFIFEV